MYDDGGSRTIREIENLRAENERLRQRLDLLSELSRRITSSLDLEAVLQHVVDAACGLTGARYGALGVFDESNRIQQFITHGLSEEERGRIGHLPQGLGVLGLLQGLQRPIRLTDLAKHERSVGFPPNHPPMKTFLGAPVRYQDEALGNLYLTEKAGGGEFTPEDESLLVLFAAQAAAAIHNARLHHEVDLQRQSAELEQLRLEAILNSSLDGIIYLDTATNQVYSNTRAREVMGIPRGAEREKASYEATVRSHDGSELPRDVLPLNRALSGDTVLGEEHLIVSPLHQSTPVLCSAAPVRDAEGKVAGAVVQFQDMTAIKLAQGRIAELAAERGRLLELNEVERKRLEALVHASPIGVLVTDAATQRVQLINREAVRILGYEGGSGEPLERYLTTTRERPDGRPYPAEELPIMRSLFKGETVHAEGVRFRYPDGSTTPTLISATPLSAGDGAIAGSIAVIQDISPLLEVERLRNDFLGVVSHELKTPLTAIKGAASTFLGSRSGFSEAETRELFELIDRESDRLRGMVDDLLDMSRIESGALSVTLAPMDLTEVLQEVRSTLKVCSRSLLRKALVSSRHEQPM